VTRFAPDVERLLAGAGYPEGDSRRWLAGLIAACAIMMLTFLLSWFVVQVAGRGLRRIAARTTTDLDDRILDILDRPVRRLVVVIGTYLAVRELPLPAQVGMMVSGVLAIFIAVVAVRVATQVSLVLLLAYGSRVEDDVGKERFAKDYVPLLTKILGAVFFVVALIYVLHHFGQNVSSLLAALGIGGAAIALGARDTISHMIAGFMILVDRPFRPGDRIKLVSGEIGDIVEVGTRSTRIKLLDQNMLVVPNSDLMNQRVVNLTYPAHPPQAALEVRVAYGSDVEAVKQLVLGVLKQVPEVLAEPAPTALFTAFGDHALVLTLTYTISQFADAARAQDQVRVAVYRKLAEAGVKIPFPTREIVSAAR
jgi:small-conductance mechanosensitive channel